MDGWISINEKIIYGWMDLINFYQMDPNRFDFLTKFFN